METFAQTQQKSRLGQILLDKRLVSQEQLSKAMEQQATTGERLGDILTQWNVVTQRHIESALRAQRTLRMVAYLTTATMTPLLTACGGGGGGATPQNSTTQAAATTTTSSPATAAAIPNASDSTSTSPTPTITSWVIKESVCCAATGNTTTTTPNSVMPATSTALVTATATTPATTPSTVVTATAPASPVPIPPSNLTAYAANTTRVVLSWDEIQTQAPGYTTYRVYRNGSAVAMSELTGNTFLDTTASPNTTYTYQIRTVDSNENLSGLSIVVSATTPAS